MFMGCSKNYRTDCVHHRGKGGSFPAKIPTPIGVLYRAWYEVDNTNGQIYMNNDVFTFQSAPLDLTVTITIGR